MFTVDSTAGSVRIAIVDSETKKEIASDYLSRKDALRLAILILHHAVDVPEDVDRAIRELSRSMK